MADLDEQTTKQTTEVMTDCMKDLDNMLPGFGKVLIVFGQDAPEMTNYISNCSRDEIIKALRETADRIEKNA